MTLILFNKEKQAPSDGQLHYNGFELPRDKKTFQRPIPDPTNNPSLVIIGGITLPDDTAIFIDGEKIIAATKILDGVQVLERISREPYEIEFQSTIRAKDANGSYIFGQDQLDNLWSNVWLPDTVQTVQNTYLNKLGIQQIVIKRISPATVRGSINIPVRIEAIENVPGETIIL